MKTGDAIAQHMAQERGFKFTETPSKDPMEMPMKYILEFMGVW